MAPTGVRGPQSIRQENEAFRYVRSNPNDLLFMGCATEDEKVVKLFELSAKRFAEKTGEFSEEVDLDMVLSQSVRKKKRKLFKRVMDSNKNYYQSRIDDAARAYRAYMMQSQFYQNIRHPPYYSTIPPHTHAHALTPMNVFGAPAAPADKNSENISQLVTAMKISNDNVAGLTTAVGDVKIGLQKEGEARREGIKTVQNNVDRNTVRIDGNTARIDEHKGEIDQIKHHRAEDKAEVEQLKDKLVEEVTKRQALESKVDGLVTQWKKVATPAPKKEVLWKPAPANAKKPVASKNKKTGKSTPAATRSSTRSSAKTPTASAPLRRSARTSVRRNEM